MKKKNYNDEIDLSNILINLWEQKLKIIVITSAFIILGFFYDASKDKTFIVTTNIKPVSTFEEQKYIFYNNIVLEIYNSYQIEEFSTKDNLILDEDSKINIIRESIIGELLSTINREILLDLFIDKIQTEEIIKKGIIKYQLINIDNFNDAEDYEEEVSKTAVLITDGITAPKIKKNNDKNQDYWKFTFKVNNKKNWKNFLVYLENQANEEIRLYLIDKFEIIAKILRSYSVTDVENIEKKISNAIIKYERETFNRLAFLKEQAEIARALNIPKNTLEAETFQNIITLVKSDSEYYARGYETIEKEISLIESRKNIKAFIPKLILLEEQKRSILYDTKIEKFKSIYTKTPVFNKNNFKSAKIDYVATTYKEQLPFSKTFQISVVIGLIVSLIYLSLINLKNKLKYNYINKNK